MNETAKDRREPVPDEPVVEIYRTTDWRLAEMICEYLESEGIRAAQRGNTFRLCVPNSFDCTFTDLGIQVLQSDAERATGLIKDYLAQIGIEDSFEDKGEP